MWGGERVGGLKGCVDIVHCCFHLERRSQHASPLPAVQGRVIFVPINLEREKSKEANQKVDKEMV